MADAKITAVYYGQHDAMIAEVAAFDPCAAGCASKTEARYLVVPHGDAQFDTEWFQTKRAAREHARYIASHYAGSKVCAV